MATQNFEAGRQPADVALSLGLVPGTSYTLQNISTVATLFLREAPTEPASSEPAFRIEAGGYGTIKPTLGQGVWLWTDNTHCPVVISEAT